ncbi:MULTISPECIES: glycosyltransferase [Pseudoalteromonas]|uniref:glycosyltransferase n=1 Tax=Pseudoalteromonas TaxID=53246 RepID=UPI001584027B|nr:MULTISPECIES: glycosyltransferase [Pseudoalteromonas]MDI4652869.1 glycosyltransferase [Pseudoalteromonas shioyasakiensis]NUJ39657.1 glycosyltransferase [Pseudoalteromonas sp. 0303]
MTILYDFIEVAGGAEKVSVELANSLKCPLVVSGINDQAIDLLPKIENEIITLGNLTALPVWKSIKSIKLFEQINPDYLAADKVLFSGSNAPIAVQHSCAAKNFYYCHTPPRFAYDLFDYYQNTLPSWQALIIKKLAQTVKRKYEPAIQQMDHVYANSHNVKNRLKKYLNVESTVIYPPVDISRYFNSSNNGYYLSTARLEEYKRVELIVDAFKEMPSKELVMISGGSLLKKLQESAKGYSNISIVGWTEQTKLYQYIAECIATIYIPVDEDFGMSPVESMAAGKPVIGVSEGGVKETVVDSVTGILIPPSPTKEDLINAVIKLDQNAANKMKSACVERANQFKPRHFFDKFRDIML